LSVEHIILPSTKPSFGKVTDTATPDDEVWAFTKEMEKGKQKAKNSNIFIGIATNLSQLKKKLTLELIGD
jgi:hypothetical protein